ncbi:MAG: hypothetical protein K0R40_1750 [Burkholderiales bacterium]|jgi:hypothetical protein|nr:hypothetical protein [Burkholderiales bacterium]
MRKIGSVPIFLLFALGTAQAGDCPFDTWERDIVVRISATREAIELRRKHSPADAPAECVLQLDCKVRGEPVGIEYDLATLARPKTAPRYAQVRRVTFAFADGSRQSCARKNP